MKKKYVSPEFAVVSFDTPAILAGGTPEGEGSTLVYPDPFEDATQNTAQAAKIQGDFKQK